MKALHTFLIMLAIAAILPALMFAIDGPRWPMLALGSAMLTLALVAPKPADPEPQP